MRRLEKQRSELAGGAVLLDRIYVWDEDAIRHVAKLAKIAFSKIDSSKSTAMVQGGLTMKDELFKAKFKLALSTTDASVISWLSDDCDERIRSACAANINSPLDILRKLANDWNPSVRYTVACNNKTSVSILLQLIESSLPNNDYGIREVIANRYDCPSEILEILSEDTKLDVKVAVKNNKNSSQEILEKLKEVPSEITTEIQQ